MSQIITVKALDAQQRVKYSWPAMLLAQEEDLIVLHGDWERLLQHAEGQQAAITNRSIEFYPLHCPYTISAILDQQGRLQEYYGRVTLPPLTHKPGKEISFVMLGLDLQVKPDFDYEILDRAQEETSKQAQQGLIELVELIERREGPFDREYLRPYLQQVRQRF